MRTWHGLCRASSQASFPQPEADIRTFVVSLIGAAAFTAGLVFFRQQKQVEAVQAKAVPAGETVPRTISLERLRELGY